MKKVFRKHLFLFSAVFVLIIALLTFSLFIGVISYSFLQTKHHSSRVIIFNNDDTHLYNSWGDEERFPNNMVLDEWQMIQVHNARENGFGYNRHWSVTEGQMMNYFALRINDSDTLELALQDDQIAEILIGFILIFLIELLIILIIISFLSKRISNKIVQPFEDVNFTPEGGERNALFTEKYPEFTNFISKIDSQAALQRRFSANASHEFKTPLATIQANNFSNELIAKETNNQELLENTNEIQNEIEYMFGLLDAMLSLGELQSIKNNDTLQTDEINLKEFVSRITSTYSKQNYKQINTSLQDAAITANKVLLKSLFINLIDNAISHSKDKVAINVFHNEKAVVIQILNDGDRIPLEERDNIFYSFYQVKNESQRELKSKNSQRNIGIGLSIVKYIVNLHHWRISVKENDNLETVFEIVIDNNN